MSEILKLASASQSGEQRRGGDGVSLDELKKIGAELGYDPQRIESAAAQLGESPRTGFLNGRVVLDQTVDGEVDGESWLGMVAAIQRYYKGGGAITQRGPNFDWAASEDSGSLAVTVRVRNGSSRIRVESNRWLEIFMATVVISMIALVVSLSLTKHGEGVLTVPVLLFFGAVYFWIIRSSRAHHLQRVGELMERLAEEVQLDRAVHPLENSTLTTPTNVVEHQALQS